jgi:hypothetical protein
MNGSMDLKDKIYLKYAYKNIYSDGLLLGSKVTSTYKDMQRQRTYNN